MLTYLRSVLPAIFTVINESQIQECPFKRLDEVDEVKFEDPYHLPQSACDKSCVVKKRINPYQNRTRHPSTFQKRFTLSCFRCAVCLAVAQEIGETVRRIGIGTLDPVQEVNNLEDALDSLCTFGFERFDLRSYKGESVIMEVSDATAHISTEMDGQWPLRLRNACSTYVSNMDMFAFYATLMKNGVVYANYFCRRKDEMFRDCFNVQLKTIIFPNSMKKGDNEDVQIYLRLACTTP